MEMYIFEYNSFNNEKVLNMGDTHWIESGEPVNVTDLSGMPPLSVG